MCLWLWYIFPCQCSVHIKTHRCFSKTFSYDFIMRNSLSITKVGSLWNKWRVCWIREPSKDKEDNAEKLNYFLCTADICEVAKIVWKVWWMKQDDQVYKAMVLLSILLKWSENKSEKREMENPPPWSFRLKIKSTKWQSFMTTVTHSKTWRYNLECKKRI